MEQGKQKWGDWRSAIAKIVISLGRGLFFIFIFILEIGFFYVAMAVLEFSL